MHHASLLLTIAGSSDYTTENNRERTTMKLRQYGSNQTELSLLCGAVVFFSYETPVAALLPSGRYIRTEKKWSVTTSKHINKWLTGVTSPVEQVPQEELHRLVGDV